MTTAALSSFPMTLRRLSYLVRYGQHAQRQFHEATRIGPLENALKVGPNRRFADSHCGGDLPITHAAKDQLDNPCLLGGELHFFDDGLPVVVIQWQRRNSSRKSVAIFVEGDMQRPRA